MGTISGGDYVVISFERKKALVRVGAKPPVNSVYRGVIVDETAVTKDTRQLVEFEPSDVLANLGAQPKHGSSYGVKIEPYLKSLDHPLWGPIHLFRRLEQIEEKVLIERLTDVGQRLKKLGVFPYRKETWIMVKPSAGKYWGTYLHNTKAHDVLTYKADSFDTENLDYILAHEYGHAIWYTMTPKSWRSKWTKMYVTNTDRLASGANVLQTMLADYRSSGVKLSEFRRGLDERDQLVLNEIVSHIRKLFSLDPRHLDELKESAIEQLETIWPKFPVELPQRSILISDYANKSVEELWAEAFSFWFVGKQIPPKLENAVTKTLEVCRLTETVNQ